jgi:hypothetical protein
MSRPPLAPPPPPPTQITASKFSTPVGRVQVSLLVNVSVMMNEEAPPPPAPCEVCSRMVSMSNAMPLVTFAVAVIVKVKST